jgi:hypothetical protein
MYCIYLFVYVYVCVCVYACIQPDGWFYLRDADVRAHLDVLPVDGLPGIGPKKAKRFRAMDVLTVGDLRTKVRCAMPVKHTPLGFAIQPFLLSLKRLETIPCVASINF